VVEVYEVYLIRRAAAKRGVRPDGILKADVATDAGTGLWDLGVGVEIHVLVFDPAPETLKPRAIRVFTDKMSGKSMNQPRLAELLNTHERATSCRSCGSSMVVGMTGTLF